MVKTRSSSQLKSPATAKKRKGPTTPSVEARGYAADSPDDKVIDELSIASGQSSVGGHRSRLPVETETQLLEDIEDDSGLHNNQTGVHHLDKGKKQGLDKLLDEKDRPELYGVRGSALRLKVRKRVDKIKAWSRSKYLTHLEALGIEPHGFRKGSTTKKAATKQKKTAPVVQAAVAVAVSSPKIPASTPVATPVAVPVKVFKSPPRSVNTNPPLFVSPLSTATMSKFLFFLCFAVNCC